MLRRPLHSGIHGAVILHEQPTNRRPQTFQFGLQPFRLRATSRRVGIQGYQCDVLAEHSCVPPLGLHLQIEYFEVYVTSIMVAFRGNDRQYPPIL